jgi:hypothetical protein
VFTAHNKTLYGNLTNAQYATVAGALETHFSERCDAACDVNMQ